MTNLSPRNQPQQTQTGGMSKDISTEARKQPPFANQNQTGILQKRDNPVSRLLQT